MLAVNIHLCNNIGCNVPCVTQIQCTGKKPISCNILLLVELLKLGIVSFLFHFLWHSNTNFLSNFAKLIIC